MANLKQQILILGHNDATQFVDIYNQYTRLFAPEKYDVTVAYLTGEENPDTKQRMLTSKVLFLNFSKKNIRHLKIVPIQKLIQLCREKKFQIVICHRYKATYIMLWVAQFCKIPVLIGVMHELNTMTARGRQLSIAFLQRKNLMLAGVSNAVRDDIRKNITSMPPERIVTLYNMIDIDMTEPQLLSREDARTMLHLSDDMFVFGNIARLVPNKNQAHLIHSFSLIKIYCPRAKLIIIGDGILEERLKTQVIQYGLQNEVIFTGYLSSAFRYMKAFDCFVLSSIQEAFGRVLLEAMLAKLPLIATSVHGIPEVVGDVGTLVDPTDAAALAFAMKQIYRLSPEERLQLGERAYQHVEKKFSIPCFQKQFWQLLEN